MNKYFTFCFYLSVLLIFFSIGVYKNDGPYEGFIEINDVPELKSIFMDNSGIMLGGNVTLTAMIDMFEKSSKIEGLTYTRDFLYHCRRIASLSIRNVIYFIICAMCFKNIQIIDLFKH